MLMRKWRDRAHADSQELFQIVLPAGYREQVLKLAHEHVLSGHLVVTKTFRRVSRYFYWPGLKSDMSNFCRSCPVCQLAGKPNKNIPVAPLQPIPVMRKPFERLLVDCVGPVPKSMSGH